MILMFQVLVMYKLLLVDDNAFEREGIIFLLKKHHIPVQIQTVSNGLDALEKLKTHHFDILITDIKMPIMSGIDLIKRTREFNQVIEIIVISGFNDFEYARSILNENVSAYILKPVNVLELIDAIQQLSILKKGDAASHSKPIQQIIAIMETSFSEDLTLEDLAERVFLSPSYVSNLFKKEVGVGISKYLNDIRLTKAADLLKNSHMKINDIADYVGIKNTSYFNRIFKNQYKLTPTQFRDQELNHDSI